VVPEVVIVKSSVMKAAVAVSSDDRARAAVEASIMETAAPVATSVARQCHCWRGQPNDGNGQ
jgi:hypothetical protein